jgi:hypothetical protein
VLRIGASISRERALHPQVFVFDLGNNLSTQPSETTKNSFILNGMAEIRPTASLLNMTEFELLQEPISAQNFVLTNLKSPPKPNVAEVRAIGAVRVFGYLWRDHLRPYLVPWQEALSPRRIERVAGSGKENTKVLLFSGPTDQLEGIAKSNVFDVIISSNAKPADAPIVGDEKERPGMLLRSGAGGGVYQVPIGGQGILRGGSLRAGTPKLPIEIPGQKKHQSFDANLGELMSDEVVTWLGLEFNTGSPLAKVMADYNAALKGNFKAVRNKRLSGLVNTPYAAAAACERCHPAEVAKWQTTKHSRAYDVLVAKGKDEDPECVACHTLGFASDGGFVSKADSPQFANVQCENCHGPGLAHAKDPKVSLALPNEGICSGCHHPPHSTQFSFKEYWPRVQHGKGVLKPR